jgi:hypothetical protein
LKNEKYLFQLYYAFQNGFYLSNQTNNSYHHNGESHKEVQSPIGSPKQTLRANLLNCSVGRPSSMIGYPSIASGDLNVTNPRYAAKYGNPYLRECDTDFPPPPSQILQSFPSPLIIGSQFHATSPIANGSPDTYHKQVPKFQTMPNNSPRMLQSNPSLHRERTFNGSVPTHYIQAHDKLNNGRLATHV